METEQDDLSQDYLGMPGMTEEEKKVELVTLLKRKRDLLLQDQAGDDEVKKASEYSLTYEAASATGGAIVDAGVEAIQLGGEIFERYAEWATGREGLLDELKRNSFMSINYQNVKDAAPQPETAIGKGAKSIMTFVAGFATFSKGMAGANILTKSPLAKNTLAGALTDFTVFDGQDKNLSNMLVELGSETDNPFAVLAKNAITEYLAKDGSESEFEGRMKTSLEGLGIGGVIDGVLRSYRAFKGMKIAQKNAKQTLHSVDDVEIKPITEDIPSTSTKTQVTPDESIPTKAVKDAPEEAPRDPLVDLKTTDEDPVELATIAISKENAEAFQKSLAAGDIKKTQELVDFNHNTYDWNKIAEGNDVRDLINATSRHFADEIKSAGANVVVSEKTTARVANLVGQSAEVVHKVHKDVVGNHGLSARMLAAEKVMIASAQRLKTLATKAKELGEGNNGDAMAELHAHIQVHASIQAEVRGAKAEVGRAMHAMRILKESSGDFQEFERLRAGIDGAKKQNNQDLIDAILDPKSLGDLNETVRGFSGLKPFDIVTEVAINGLLSSMKTHTLNIASNALNVGFGVGTRWGAVATGALRRKFGAKAAVDYDEALAYTQGTLQGMREGLGVAWKALKTRGPVTDPIQRIEFMNRKAIHIDSDTIMQWELDDNHGTAFLAKGMNVLGEIIRAPGTALVAGDEFFKATARRGQLNALAVREAQSTAQRAVDMGAKDYQKVYKKTLKTLMDKPTAQMKADAVLFARKQTFQETPGSVGRQLETVLNSNKAVKLFIFPFVRTPMNLVKQAALDNSPFGLASRTIRDTIRKGGPEADLAIARMTLGGTMMASVIPLWESGDIVGARGGYRNTEGMDHVEPYSIKIPGTDTWISYDRADPFGMMLGMTADFMAAMEADYDPSDVDYDDRFMKMGGGIFASVSSNVLSNTWMQSASELLDLLQSGDAKSPDDWRKFFTKRSTMLTPFGSLSRSITNSNDPTVRDVDSLDFWGHFEKMMPWASEDLPPKRDYLGREVLRSPSKRSVWNPYVTSVRSDDPLDNYMSSLAFDFTMPSRKKDGVRLTAEQYSRWGEIMNTLGDGALDKSLRQLIADKEFTGLPRDTQVNQVKDIVSLFRSQALEMLKAEDRDLAGKLEWAYRVPRLKQNGVHPEQLPIMKDDFFKQFK